MIRTTILDSGWEFAQAEWLLEQPFGYTRVPGWLPATVPGHVHLDLVATGIIRHPFEEMAELGCQWVDEKDWSYRTHFEWASREDREQRVLLFEGLDTICTVFLNGEVIGRHDNMFLPLEIEVTDLLLGGQNELRVDFQSAVRVGRERRAAYFLANGLADDTANFEERAFVRKAQYMFGWDWGPRLVSCGIWKAVKLLEGETGELAQSSRTTHRDTEGTLGTVQLRREADQFGESFQFFVNGKPIWAMGANWIPVHSFPSQTEKLRGLLESCKAMNFNMLRVWGGGLYESDEFYEICDELAILVWQDFPFACSYYPDDKAFVNSIRVEATYHVKRLRHHPCLALWCGNNEILTMWEGKWGGDDKQPPRLHGEKIWNEVLKQIVEEHDPGRPYIPTSPIGSPPGKEDCNAGGYGDSHYWDVWHGRGDWIHYRDSTARFSSEFGFPSSCGMQAWERVTRPSPQLPSPFFRDPISPTSTSRPREKNEEGGPESPILRWHDKSGRPWSYLRDLITRHYPEPQDLEEWIYFSQLNQRDAMRCAIEHYRRSEFCKGTLIWQANDCWPVQSWSLIDSEGDWKAAAYEMQRLFAHRLSCLNFVGQTVEYWIANDTDEPAQVEAALQIRDSLTGKRLDAVFENCKIEAHSRRIAFTRDLTSINPTQAILTIDDGRTAYLLCEPKDLQLEKPTIRSHRDKNDWVMIETDAPVVDLRLWDPTGRSSFTGDGAQMFGFCDALFPGVSRSFWFEGEIGQLMGRSLAGVHEIDIFPKTEAIQERTLDKAN